MPLNIPDQGEPKDGKAGQQPGPASSAPRPGDPTPETPARRSAAMIDDAADSRSARKLLLWIFAIVVLASAAFLLVQFKIISLGGSAGDRSAFGDSAISATAPAIGERPGTGTRADSGISDDARAAELRQRLARNGGEFTIYISAFATAADAEDLAGRWERAGFQAAVIHSGGWYRVGLGRFQTVSSARDEAEKLRQAFEEGYWIGRASGGD